jgi:hypothetical protein
MAVIRLKMIGGMKYPSAGLNVRESQEFLFRVDGETHGR